MKSSKSDLKYILIQGLITLLIAFIPIYFYIDASIKNQDIKDKLDLQNYSNQIIPDFAIGYSWYKLIL